MDVIILFIHSSFNGSLFLLLAVVINPAMNNGTFKHLFESLLSILLGVYLGVDLLEHMIAYV